VITVDALEVAYGDVPVLEGVSVSVERGELVGLVGPNGAGKTTLLRVLSGALSPDGGTVLVDGTDVHTLPSKASSRLLSVVPQDTHLSFSFDVRDVVEMGRTPHRSRFSGPTREDREIVDTALERTRTAGFADRSIDDVSGGERQRVLLARAIAQDTPVVLLDEPTASLDVNHQIETLELVSDLVSDGTTAVAAIHDLDLAARYCDRLVVLAGGRIVDSGPPDSVLTTDTVATAFDATAAVTTNPLTGTPTVTTLAAGRDDLEDPPAVHVLGSGPTAAGVLARLEAAGVPTTAGPVPRGSAVSTATAELDLEAIVADPFGPLSAEDLETLEGRVRAADVTVLADLEVSAGNQLVLERVARVTPALVAVESRPFDERNYAGDDAAGSYEGVRKLALEATTGDVLEAVTRAADAADRPASRRLGSDV